MSRVSPFLASKGSPDPRNKPPGTFSYQLAWRGKDAEPHGRTCTPVKIAAGDVELGDRPVGLAIAI
jgi:hypothetical protein